MNLLEHYIEKIISVEPFNPPTQSEWEWVTVKMLVNCYGSVVETEMLLPVDDWEKIKAQGYYMA